MPFQPGHKINVGSKGTSLQHRRNIRQLASVIRDRNDPEAISAWYECIADGRDPLDPTGPACVDLKTRMEAKRMLVERGWGATPQTLVVEGLIRSEQPSDVVVRPKRTLEEINAQRLELKRAIDPQRIIDVTPGKDSRDAG